jgi:phosphoglycolate phosphatase
MQTLQDLTQIDAVIFDLDGTLVHTLGDFQVALHRTMVDLDLPPVSDALIAQTIGKGSEHLIRSLLAHQIARPEVKGVGQACAALTVDALFDRAWQRYQHHYLAINGQFADVYPGVLDVLKHLAANNVPMACLTNKPLAFAQALLKDKALTHFFGPVFGGDSFERKKPDPLPILKTCEALGTSCGAHLDGGRLQQRCPSRSRCRVPGGAGDLWLQPWPTRARHACCCLVRQPCRPACTLERLNTPAKR